MSRFVIYHFGHFHIDTDDRTLRSADKIYPLPPKAVDTLIYLLERPQTVVSRESLQSAIWPSVFVEENNLTQYISLLRRTLGDRSDTPLYIETVARRGYRLCCQVERTLSPDTTLDPPSMALSSGVSQAIAPASTRLALRRPLFSRSIALALASVAVVAGAYALWKYMERAPLVDPYSSVSITVLPAEITRAEAADGFESSALTDYFVRDLSSAKANVRIHPTASVSTAPDQAISPQSDTDLTISIKLAPQADDRVSLTVTAFRKQDSKPVWTGNQSGKFANIFDLEESLAARLNNRLWGRNIARPPAPITRNLPAYAAFLHGQADLDLRTSKGIYSGLDALEQAVAADPHFAEAYADLAEGYAFDISLWNRAEPTARKALVLDPNLGRAHAVIGLVHLLWLDDCPGAAEELKKAIRLKPDDALAHLWYADLFAQVNRNVEALAEVRIARDLDPHSLPIATAEARFAYFIGDFEYARELCEKIIAENPAYMDAHALLLRIQLLRHDDAAAMAELRHLETLAGDSAIYSSSQIAVNDRAYARGGMRAVWQARVNYLQSSFQDSNELALAFAALGHDKEAFHQLEIAIGNRRKGRAPVLFVQSDPAFHRLHADLEFRRLTHNPGT